MTTAPPKFEGNYIVETRNAGPNVTARFGLARQQRKVYRTLQGAGYTPTKADHQRAVHLLLKTKKLLTSDTKVLSSSFGNSMYVHIVYDAARETLQDLNQLIAEIDEDTDDYS